MQKGAYIKECMCINADQEAHFQAAGGSLPSHRHGVGRACRRSRRLLVLVFAVLLLLLLGALFLKCRIRCGLRSLLNELCQRRAARVAAAAGLVRAAGAGGAGDGQAGAQRLQP